MNWQDIQLGEAIHVKHGFAFKGEFFASSGDYMVLTPGNFFEREGFVSERARNVFTQTIFQKHTFSLQKILSLQ